jgi:hypothetical protein
LKAEKDLKNNSGVAEDWHRRLDAVRKEHIDDQKVFQSEVRDVKRAIKNSAIVDGGSDVIAVDEEVSLYLYLCIYVYILYTYVYTYE